MYIVFEGINGSGKSTQCEMLGRALDNYGYTPVYLHEPSHGETGRLIRSLIKSRTDTGTRELHELFTKDRKEHVRDNIEPLLNLIKTNASFFLLQSRGYLSAPAYQAQKSQDIFAMLAEQQRIAPRPDMFIYIDIDEKEAMARIRQRGADSTIFDSERKLKYIRERYKALVDNDSERIVEFDGTLNPDTLHENIWRLVLPELRD